MATPWQGRPRWTCKYCNVTINDDVPSRTHHENGLRHKHNVEQSLRNAYKQSHRERADEDKARRAMEQIERLARERNEKDAPSGSTSEAKEDKEAKQATKAPSKWQPKDRMAAYGSALPTGVDWDAKVQEEKLQEFEQQREEQKKEGTVGEWQAVAVTQGRTAEPKSQSQGGAAKETAPKATSSAYKITEKQGHFDRDDDEGDLVQINVKKRKAATSEEELQRRKQEREREMMPTWTAMRLDTGVGVKEEGVQAVPIRRIAKDEAGEVSLVGEEHGEKAQDKAQDPTPSAVAPASGSMFKKRKAGAGAGAKKVRAVI